MVRVLNPVRILEDLRKILCVQEEYTSIIVYRSSWLDSGKRKDALLLGITSCNQRQWYALAHQNTSEKKSRFLH